jgi:hypothetical protein
MFIILLHLHVNQKKCEGVSSLVTHVTASAPICIVSVMSNSRLSSFFPSKVNLTFKVDKYGYLVSCSCSGLLLKIDFIVVSSAASAERRFT